MGFNRSRVVTATSAFLAVAAFQSSPQLQVAPLSLPGGSAIQSAATAAIEVVVLDRDGQPVADLGPADFTVTIDRRPRNVVGVRNVIRGPGAVSEASVRQTEGGVVVYAAEPARNVLVVVDQATLTRGRERAVVQAGGAFLDRLGLDDRVAVLRVPIQAQALLTLTTERPEARETLRMVAGQASASAGVPGSAAALDQPDRAAGVVDPDRTGDPEKPLTEKPPQELEGRPVEGLEDPVVGTLAEIDGLLRSLARIPGRKAVALFSAGIVGGTPAAVERTALAAAAAYTVIHAFRIEGGGGEDDPRRAPDPAGLERLARMTGGGFVSLGRNPDRAIDRAIPALSACYVLTIEADPSDTGPGRFPAVRVEVSRQKTTVLSASRLVATGDPGDIVPPPPAPAQPTPPEPEATDKPAAERTPAKPAPVSPAERAAREAELQLVMARLNAYVAGYQRQYSALVAEEEYWQQDRNSRRTVKSDLLLVKPATEWEDWVIFRDVFEVDGNMVRDREDRLKKLFLDSSPEAQLQLARIKEESSRFNIGLIERNINHPLFTLKFFSDKNRPGFEFRLAGRQQVTGIEAWKVEYLEVGRPTVIRQGHDLSDMPARGFFLVDPMTGAILETRMEFTFDKTKAEFVVRFRRDQGLGLWVPSEMRETYLILTQSTVTLPGGRGGQTTTTYQSGLTTLTEARATYSNFRRFQVKTEERIVIPKQP